MSRLLELQRRIQDTNTLIAQIERTVRATKDAPAAVIANLRSLESRLEMLERDFLALTDRYSKDVCSYRMFNPGDRYKLSGYAKTLADFQAVFSLTCDALKNGPKQRAVVSPDVEALTSFEFGYAFSGSVGVVLTLENERLLLGETLLDETVGVVFSMARAEESADVAAFAKRLGPPPIRALFKWASDHLSAETGADIQWRKDRSVTATLLIQQPELERLRDAIAATSDEKTHPFTYRGVLTGIDTTTKRFRFQLPDGREIAGSSGNVVNEGHSVEVPSNQTARVELKTKTHYSMDRDEETWTLLGFGEEPSS